MTTQAHPTQSRYGCSTTTHCHTREPEHYRRCRQTQYAHGARNRRTHRPVHNSASDTAPRRHGCIHTRHIHKTRPTFQTSSTIPVTKDQPKRLQIPARTLLPAPTHSVHTRRSPSAHPPLGAQLCTRHGSTAAYTLDTPTNYIRHGLTATHRLHTTTTPPKPNKPGSTSRLTCCLPWEPRQAQPGPLSCYNRIQNPTGLPPSCKLLRRQYRAPSPQPRQGHP